MMTLRKQYIRYLTLLTLLIGLLGAQPVQAMGLQRVREWTATKKLEELVRWVKENPGKTIFIIGSAYLVYLNMEEDDEDKTFLQEWWSETEEGKIKRNRKLIQVVLVKIFAGSFMVPVGCYCNIDAMSFLGAVTFASVCREFSLIRET